MQQVSGIYVIQNRVSGKRYIGSTVNFKKRWESHFNALNRQVHNNRHLQHAWNLRGKDAFSFTPLLLCSADDLFWFEQRAIDVYIGTFGRRNLYNLSPTASGVRGIRLTKEHRRKLAEAGKGRLHSAETKAKMRLAALGNQRNAGRKPSDEHRANLSAALKGRKVTWGDKISAGQKGRVFPSEHRAKLSAASKRQKWSDERRESQSQRMTGNKIGLGNKNGVGHVYTPEQREARRLRALGNKNSAGKRNHLGHRLSETTKQKIREARIRTVAAKTATSRIAQKALFAAAVLACCLVFAGTSKAQTPQDDPVAKALEQAINRLAVAEEKNRLLEDRLAAKDAIITAKDGIIAVRDQQLELALSANKDRAGANVIDAFRVEACQQQLAKADAEIARLRNPGFLRSLFDVKSITGAVVGFGIGRATAPK